MRLRALALAAALVLPGSPAYAATGPTTVATDPCGDGSHPSHDLVRVDLHYSATSFQVRYEMCDDNLVVDMSKGYVFDLHLVSLGGARVHAWMDETTRFPTWMGMSVCTTATACTPIQTEQWDGTTGFAHGAWADVLPGVTIPESIDWYATVDTPEGDDRAPDAGNATSYAMASPRSSHLTIAPIPPARYYPLGTSFEAYGTLRLDSPTGPPVTRYVTLRRPDGSWMSGTDNFNPRGGCDPRACPGWRTFFSTTRNATVVASYDGDGFVAASNRPSAKALVTAWVTLNQPTARTVSRGTQVVLSGVVRPKVPQGQTMLVQVRNGGAGAPWRTFAEPRTETRYGESAYSVTWRPTVTGTATFRVVWTHGTTADGDVADGISNYTTITVT